MHFILYALCITLLFLVTSVILITIYYYFKLFTAKYYLNKLPMLPQVPILGSMLLYSNTSDYYEKCMNYSTKYGKNYWCMIGLEPVLCTTDARLSEIILSSPKHIQKPGFYKVFHKAGGKGLVSSNGKWSIHVRNMGICMLSFDDDGSWCNFSVEYRMSYYRDAMVVNAFMLRDNEKYHRCSTSVRALRIFKMRFEMSDDWRTQRKLLTPTFHFKILEQFMPIFNKHSNELVKRLDVDTMTVSTDVHETTKDWSLGQVIETIMGLTSEGTSNNTTLYKEAGKELLQIIMERVIRPLEFIDYTYYFCRNYRKELRVVETLDKHIMSVIKRKQKEYDDGVLEQSKKVNEDGTKQKTVSLDLLIEYQRNGANLTESDMKGQVQTIMLAGYDTTATTVALMFYHFAKYPEVQEKVFDEAYHVLGGHINQEITSSHLKEMNYLDIALKESLRVTSSIPLMARELHEDVEYDGVTLPKGLCVFFLLSALHVDPEYFPEPEKFIPERFTPENCKKRPPYAYIPFSAGPRNCIGQKYGILAAKVGIVKAVLNYKFFSVGHELSLASEIVLTPKTGVKVGIRRRELPIY